MNVYGVPTSGVTEVSVDGLETSETGLGYLVREDSTPPSRHPPSVDVSVPILLRVCYDSRPHPLEWDYRHPSQPPGTETTRVH